MAGIEGRLVRYADLRPCTNAFVDTRTPGSDRKENFTIVGPGVSENPNQHVHIPEPHGFNIGAARQPRFEEEFVSDIEDPESRAKALKDFFDLLMRAGFR